MTKAGDDYPEARPRRIGSVSPLTEPAPAPAPLPMKPSPTMSNYFSDPLLQGYLNFGQGAIGKLTQPQGVNPTLQSAIDALTRISSQGAPRVNTGFLDEFGTTVRNRQAQLAQPGYSQSQQDILRTNVTDPLEAQRTAAREQVLQRLASRGITPDSGIAQQAIMDSDRAFSQMRTTGERNLAVSEMQQDEQRKNQSVEIGNLLAQLGLSTEGLNVQSQNANRGAQLGAAGQLGGIGEGLQQEPLQRLMSAMGIYGNMAQLPFAANQNAIASMNAINGQKPPQYDDMGQMLSLLLGLGNMGEHVNAGANANSNSAWSTFGAMLPDLIKSFGGLFGGGNTGGSLGSGAGFGTA